MKTKLNSIRLLTVVLIVCWGWLEAIGQSSIELRFLGRYSTNTYDAGGAEIAAYDAATKRLFSVNASTGSVDILNISNPSTPTLISSFGLSAYGAAANSVAAKNGIIAIAVEAVVKQDPGKVVFIDANANVLNVVNVGALPDMLCFSPDGNYVLVANEGEPNSSYTIDPEGSVSVINISGGVASASVSTAGFQSFNGTNLPYGIRIYGPNASVAQDLEPESITVSPNSQTAWVSCQENNCWAIVDIPTATVTSLVPMGFKDHSIPGAGLDASDQNSGIVNIANWPVKGMYQPDAIANFSVNGQTYLISANEGDAREYGSFVEVSRVSSSSIVLDPTKFPNASVLKNNNNLGRLNVSNKTGNIDGDNDFDTLYVPGARSISIWNTTGQLVWDSGDQLEQKMLQLLPNSFNCSNTNNTKKNRSDDKGPEPEAVTVATIGDSIFAFVGLERIGGILIYNITNPLAPYFSGYLNTRNFAQTPGLNSGGDLGPEGILFIPKSESSNGRDQLVVSNEISGTVAIYEIGVRTKIQILHASDFEASLDAVQDAPRFAAIVDTLEHTYPNTFILSSGDNVIPSPFSSAGEDPNLVTPLKNTYISYYGGTFSFNDLRAGIARPDISIMNFIGIEASALGNHEFDWGTSELRNMIAGQASGNNIRWFGTQFPYLSANLDFSADPNLSNITTNSRLSNTAFKSSPALTAAQIAAKPKIAPSCIIVKDGEKYGIVGATTPILASISSPGATSIKNPGAGTNDMSLLASILQPVVDSLRYAEGCNKIILLAHMQQINFEKQLATFLKGVDIILGGGSNSIMADNTDRLRSGDTALETYPFFTTDADNLPVAIINTDGNYRYVGRLVIDFDPSGNIIPSSVNAAISGIYPADSLGVEEVWGSGNYATAFTSGSKGQLVKTLCDAVGNVIVAKDGNLFGKTSVFLEGRRNFVRTEETNLGNLSAEANLWMARKYDLTTKLSIKNGGGIRSVIGYVNAVGSTLNLEPPLANPTAGKLQGDISQLDIENSLRFNNQLSLLNLTASGVKAILEHGVAATATGATPGQFPQIAGIRFSYDATRPVSSRVISAVIVDSAGAVTDTLVANGSVYGDPTRVYRVVTLNFLASGGDTYPFPTLGSNRVDLPTLPPAGPALASFAIPGSEQDAFAEYMKANYSTQPYAQAETPIAQDARIENLQTRADDILPLSISSLTYSYAPCATTAGIEVKFFGGRGPYLIKWNNDSLLTNLTNNTIPNLPAGAYTVSVKDAYNQQQSSTLTIVPNSTIATTSTNVATSCAQYTWNGTTYFTSGTYSITLTNAAGCDSVATLVLTITPAIDWYIDADGDGIGSTSSIITACTQPTGYSFDNSDCNDANASVYPDAVETCNGIDDDCDGDIDSDDSNVTGQQLWYADVDGDGLGDATDTLRFCNQPDGYVSNKNDCDDSDATVLAAVVYYADADQDAYGNLNVTQSSCSGAPTGYVSQAGDCNDNAASVNPAASEVCNGVDDNCDNLIDNGVPTIAAPASISGTATACLSTEAGTIAYSCDAVTGAANYVWSVPAGMSITSGQGTNSISVSYTAAAIQSGIVGQVCVYTADACTNSSPTCLNVSYQVIAPLTPGFISGANKVCPGNTQSYSIAAVARATSYTWSVPAGVSIVSGQGTNSINVSVSVGYTGGIISVTASNICGQSAARTKTIAQNLPGTPGVISGLKDGVCNSNAVSYSVGLVANATSYSWTVNGGTITSGQGSTVISVNYSTSTSNTVTVRSVNGCGISAVRSLTVVGIPARPGVITGSAAPCANTTSDYAVGTVTGATLYTWATTASGIVATGQGTKNVMISWAGPATNQGVRVVAANSCGSSTTRTLSPVVVGSCARENNAEGFSLNFWPNPANDVLFLSFSAPSENYRLTIMDAVGRTVFNRDGNPDAGATMLEVPVSGFVTGVYMVSLESAGKRSVARLIVE